MIRWRVVNDLTGASWFLDDWARRARARLAQLPGVVEATVSAVYEEDELGDGEPLAVLSVDVLVEAPDDDRAAALVEEAVTAALADAVGDEEVGWTAYAWTASRG